jgi:DNA ligase-1
MRRFAETADRIAATRSKLAKIKTLAEYFRELAGPDLRASAVFLTGRPFPLFDARVLNVGGAALVRAIQEVAGVDEQAIHAAYMKRADLGEVAEMLLPPPGAAGPSPAEVFTTFEEIVKLGGASPRLAAMTNLLRRLDPRAAKYVVKIITGDMRIGLKENTVEEAIAKAFDRPIEDVRRANMFLGDVGETAIMAQAGAMVEMRLRLFRPVKFMLATPAASEDEIFANFGDSPFFIEDKYDGIRGQLHVEPPRAALYSRTLDDISNQFPEVVRAAETFAHHANVSLIADGEVVGYKNGQVLPFARLQSRLGRKKPSDALLAEVPAALMIFDLLYFDGRTLIDEPLAQRRKLLETIALTEHLIVAPSTLLTGRVSLDPYFEQAERLRNEGLMLKEASSIYAPGKRGMSWLKWKKTLATLDVVVTAVEFGHGRRRQVLSDYTFAVQSEGKLLNIGKAYSGLTDREILEMTTFFKEHTLEDHGWFRLVEPTVVLEVTFNGVQKSARHSSGFALRFPRILRIRYDKRRADIDTLETVEQIYARHIGET